MTRRRDCTCAGTAPGYPQHEDWCGRQVVPLGQDLLDEIRRLREAGKRYDRKRHDWETAWPQCTTRGCQHAIRHPSPSAAIDAARAHRAAWVDDRGYAPCVCHDPGGFPCDESAEVAP